MAEVSARRADGAGAALPRDGHAHRAAARPLAAEILRYRPRAKSIAASRCRTPSMSTSTSAPRSTPRTCREQRGQSAHPRADGRTATAPSSSSNPGAKHSIAVGILNRLNLIIEGSLGYFGCGLIDGPNVRIAGRVGWACAENMMSGTILIEKNAGSQFGAAIRGGDLVCKRQCRLAHRHRHEGRHHHRRRRHRRLHRLHDAARAHGDLRQCRQESRRFHV